MSVESVSKLVLRALIGVVFIAAALYTGWVALHEHPIDIRLIGVAAGGLVLGGLIIDFDPIFTPLKQLLSLLPQVRLGAGDPKP